MGRTIAGLCSLFTGNALFGSYVNVHGGRVSLFNVFVRVGSSVVANVYGKCTRGQGSLALYGFDSGIGGAVCHDLVIALKFSLARVAPGISVSLLIFVGHVGCFFRNGAPYFAGGVFWRGYATQEGQGAHCLDDTDMRLAAVRGGGGVVFCVGLVVAPRTVGRGNCL